MGESGDSASKVNSKFDFTDKIFVDRYMLEYKDESNKCAEKVWVRWDKIDQIDKHIDMFHQYGEQKKNIIKSLEMTMALLES